MATLDAAQAGGHDSAPAPAGLIVESHQLWALRPDVLGAVQAVMRHHKLTPDDLASIAERPAAARPAARPTRGGVAVVPLQGVLTARPSLISLLFGGGSGLQGFRDAFRDAVNNPDVSAVLIDANSPGGSTELITETAAEVRAARGSKPIIAVANTTAASAAYWIASQADELVVTPSGEVGSVGVFAMHEDWSGFNAQMGIQPTYISFGEFKVEANPDYPLSDEAKAAIQAIVDDVGRQFAADVAKGRGTTSADVLANFGKGRSVLAKQAVEQGMADRVATLEQTAARLTAAGSTRRRAEGAPIEPTAAADDEPGIPAGEAESDTETTVSVEPDSEPVVAAVAAATSSADTEVAPAPDDQDGPELHINANDDRDPVRAGLYGLDLQTAPSLHGLGPGPGRE